MRLEDVLLAALWGACFALGGLIYLVLRAGAVRS